MRILRFSWLFLIFLYSIFFNTDVSSQCLEAQKSLLLQMKNSLSFNSSLSVQLVKWDERVDCCNWGGVDCNNDGHVIGLNLSSESISGIHNSSSLFDLQYLQSLNLAYNNFSFTEIPSGFDKLTGLTYLNLSSANFAGQIPIEISRLTRLVTLDLSSLYFDGLLSLKLENPDLLTLVDNLKGLNKLYLDGVNISAQRTGWCQALADSVPNLQALSLSNCQLSGPIDPSLAKLKSLSEIRLDNNNLSTSVPEFLADFANLTSLRLSFCGLNGAFPEKIFQVPTLQTLDLANNKLLEGSLPEFPPSGSLQTLVLSETNFSGKLPESMGYLEKLSRIELGRCNFNGSIPNSTASLVQLVHVDLSFNNFTGPVPSFSSMKNLTELNLAHNHLTGSISSTEWNGLSRIVNLDLRNNSLTGSIPLSLFDIPYLQQIQLLHNQFTGEFKELLNVSSSRLNILDLSSNNLQGPFPESVFRLKSLKILSLSSNNFSGALELNLIQQLKNLSSLDLSYNRLSIVANDINSTLSSFPQISTLKLASCKLRIIPKFLRNQSRLTYLDLSNNQIHGEIPNWIWKLGDLIHLNLSSNLLVDLEGPLLNLTPNLVVLDLHFNQIQGQIPTIPPSATYLDYSRNNFSSIIPEDIGNHLNFTIFFSLSSNNFHGSIPNTVCNGTYLQVLDLSNNSLTGVIPKCLTNMSGTLRVLNLRRNNLSGSISDTFPSQCGLKTLDVNRNLLTGKLPKSLASCRELEVLDLGNNQINDTFPCWLKSASSLRVLVMRSNKFQGDIGCSQSNSSWEKLQIIDLASNNFSGKLPAKCLLTWKAMMAGEDEAESKLNHLRFEFLGLSGLYYQDAVAVTSKGLEMKLVKILTLFTSIDFSCNNFEGNIPEVLGDFKALYVLNLSHNALTGGIPSALGKLKQLESLDLSRNNLTGAIPVQLASLNFLSFLNLSYNQLVGVIPTSTQLQSFSETSFTGNIGLCGPPLNVKCTNIGGEPSTMPRPEDAASNSGTEFDWQFIMSGLGFGVGAAIVGPLMFSGRGRKWHDECTDKLLLMILPAMGLIYKGCNDGKVDAEETVEEEDGTEDYEDEDERDSEEFLGRFCVYCSKLDISRKRAIHNPNCTYHHSPVSSSYSSSSSSEIKAIKH